MQVRKARFCGIVERHSEATALLKEPGDMALVVRGVPRMLVFACPDGCGDLLPINLDSRADKAWKLYQRKGSHTLFPSVWRDEGCRAHFILWDDVIYWSGFGDRTPPSSQLRKAVLGKLRADKYQAVFDIASSLNEIPWAVQVACHSLVDDRLVIEGVGNERGAFKLR